MVSQAFSSEVAEMEIAPFSPRSVYTSQNIGTGTQVAAVPGLSGYWVNAGTGWPCVNVQ